MQFVVVRIYKPNQDEIRERNNAAHMAWIAGKVPPNQFMGPIYGDDGTSRMGSLYVADFPNLAAARAFVASDPYTQAGIFQHVMVQPCENLSHPPVTKARPKKKAKAKAKAKTVRRPAKATKARKASRKPSRKMSRKTRGR